MKKKLKEKSYLCHLINQNGETYKSTFQKHKSSLKKQFLNEISQFLLVNKLAQKSFASPGKNGFISKMEDTKIILYVWPYALEC